MKSALKANNYDKNSGIQITLKEEIEAMSINHDQESNIIFDQSTSQAAYQRKPYIAKLNLSAVKPKDVKNGRQDTFFSQSSSV